MRLLLVYVIILVSNVSFSQGYKIDIQLKGAEQQKVYLGTYYGHQKLIADSCILDEKGKGTFAGTEAFKHGLYMIAVPEKVYFDIIVSNDQHFEVYNDASNVSENFRVKGSDENQLFSEFQATMYTTQQSLNKARTADGNIPAAIRDSIAEKVRIIRKEYIRKSTGTFFSLLLTAMEEPEVPESVIARGEEAAFQYYKQNYFSNIPFGDERFLQTPILYNKINHFFLHLCEWKTDTILRYTEMLCRKAEENKDIFYYVFNHLYHGFSVNGKFFNDEAYVYMAKTYLNSGKLWWADENLLTSMKNQVDAMEPTLIGKTAPPLDLVDSNQHRIDLTAMKAGWLILFFWDPECKNCASFYENLSRLASSPDYAEMVFVAVCISTDTGQWKKHLKEHPAPFIQTISNSASSSQLDVWNLITTPRIYVLDREMKIFLKDPDPEYLIKVLSNN